MSLTSMAQGSGTGVGYWLPGMDSIIVITDHSLYSNAADLAVSPSLMICCRSLLQVPASQDHFGASQLQAIQQQPFPQDCKSLGHFYILFSFHDFVVWLHVAEINISEHASFASLAGKSLAYFQVLGQRYDRSNCRIVASILRGSPQPEAIIRKYGCPPRRKILEMEAIRQNNGRTGIFDQWRSLYRRSSVIGERLVAFAAVVLEELANKHFSSTELFI